MAHFTVRHDALRITSDAQKQMVTGHVSVFDDGKAVTTMRPARWFFSKKEIGAHDGSRDSPRPRRRPVCRACRIRCGVAVGDLCGDRESAGELDLVGLWHHGSRHRHRPAAGAGLCVRGGEAAGRRRDDSAHPAAVASAACPCAARGERASRAGRFHARPRT